MKISINWLSDYIDITEKDHQKIQDVITANSAEVETMEKQGDHLENIIVGKIATVINAFFFANAFTLSIVETSSASSAATFS